MSARIRPMTRRRPRPRSRPSSARASRRRGRAACSSTSCAAADTRAWVVAESPWGGRRATAGLMATDDGRPRHGPRGARRCARARARARRCCAALVERARRRVGPRMTLEVRPSNERGARRSTSTAGFHERRACVRATTTTPARTRSSCGRRPRRREMLRCATICEPRGGALEAFRSATPEPWRRAADDSSWRSRRRATRRPPPSCAAAASVLSSVVASQIDFHARFGGVVPEIASRKHTEAIVGVVDEALRAAPACGFGDLDALAVTQGRGSSARSSSGVAYAKGLALATGLPLVGVNHLEGHIFANVLADPDRRAAAGGAARLRRAHVARARARRGASTTRSGATLDDAAGEAFDKVAKVLGLGYPGGPVLSRLAADGRPGGDPVPARDDALAATTTSRSRGSRPRSSPTSRRERGGGPRARPAGHRGVVPGGGDRRAGREDGAGGRGVRRARRSASAAAWRPTRRCARRCARRSEPRGVHVSVPPLDLCTDNAAMIAAAAHYRLVRGETSSGRTPRRCRTCGSD